MLDQAADLIARCSKVVVLTGAGMSAESGVPTFRGKEGLWGKFKPEQLATMDAFLSTPEIVWEWYNWRRELISEVKPNPGHFALAELNQLVDELTLVTQNVDNLHAVAGSTSILELHGNIYRNKCVNCNRQFGKDLEIDPEDIPKCDKCGGKLRPDVVWFGEQLPEETIRESFARTEQAEVFLSVGTSALVYPAAGLPMLAKQNGATVIEINPERTPISDLVDHYFAAKSGEFLPQLVAAVQKKREQ